MVDGLLLANFPARSPFSEPEKRETNFKISYKMLPNPTKCNAKFSKKGPRERKRASEWVSEGVRIQALYLTVVHRRTMEVSRIDEVRQFSQFEI